MRSLGATLAISLAAHVAAAGGLFIGWPVAAHEDQPGVIFAEIVYETPVASATIEDHLQSAAEINDPPIAPIEVTRRPVESPIKSSELQPVAPGCGGTACLSGTHNAAFPRPDVQGHNLPPWPDEFGVELATVQPGGALVFTETMLHSTFPYSGQGQRRTLFYKYHPYGMDRRAGNYTIKYDLDPPAELGFDVTDAQRRILAWPEQWDEYGLGDYGPGVPPAGAQEQTVSKL